MTKFLYYFSFILFVSLNLSFKWPVENFRLTSSFGESRGDHFHSGVDIISGQFKAHPVNGGELVFYWDKSLFPTENYPGGGNYKILMHDTGHYSVYMHLKDNTVSESKYSESDIIGEIGDTGHSSGKHLHLSIYDIKTAKYINPLTIFPEIKDNKAPEIREAYVRIDNKYYKINNKGKIRLTKNYPLLLDVSDSITGSEKLGIFKISAELNGKKILDNECSEIALSGSGLAVAGKTFQDLFDEKGYYKTLNPDYVEGTNELLIAASDYSGNKSVKKITFNVDLDIH